MQYVGSMFLELTPSLALTETVLLFCVKIHASVGLRGSLSGEEVGDTVRAVGILEWSLHVSDELPVHYRGGVGKSEEERGGVGNLRSCDSCELHLGVWPR